MGWFEKLKSFWLNKQAEEDKRIQEERDNPQPERSEVDEVNEAFSRTRGS